STTRAAVPRAKLTGPWSPLTTTVLPGSNVVTVPAVQVVLVVCVVVAGSVVVVLVCGNASGATNVQARAIIVLFIYTSLVYFDGFSRASCSGTCAGVPGLSPFSLGRVGAAAIRMGRASINLTRLRDRPDACHPCSRRTRPHARQV